MEWAKAVSEAVRYIENHITEGITMYEVAEHVNISPFYFHKCFSMSCGYSIGEYKSLFTFSWTYASGSA